jgi:hypothetical protein
MEWKLVLQAHWKIYIMHWLQKRIIAEALYLLENLRYWQDAKRGFISF